MCNAIREVLRMLHLLTHLGRAELHWMVLWVGNTQLMINHDKPSLYGMPHRSEKQDQHWSSWLLAMTSTVPVFISWSVVWWLPDRPRSADEIIFGISLDRTHSQCARILCFQIPRCRSTRSLTISWQTKPFLWRRASSPLSVDPVDCKIQVCMLDYMSTNAEMHSSPGFVNNEGSPGQCQDSLTSGRVINSIEELDATLGSIVSRDHLIMFFY